MLEWQSLSIPARCLSGFATIWQLVDLTRSGLWVSVAGALFAMPLLLGGAWAGVLVDHLPRRRLLFVTQAGWIVTELALLCIAATGRAQPWMVCVPLIVGGVINAVELPARDSFLGELVDSRRLANAVALRKLVSQVATVVGPAVGGVVIALSGDRWGVTACFAISAVATGVSLVALAAIKVAQPHRRPHGERARRRLRHALRHVRGEPALWVPLAILGLVGTLSPNLAVLVPLLAAEDHGSVAGYALLSIVVGVGSAGGALAIGSWGRSGPRTIVGAVAALGAFELLARHARTLPWQMVSLAALGALSVIFVTVVNARLLHTADSPMHGRVMALYQVGLRGSTTLGIPLTGWLTDTWSPRAPLLVGGLAALIAALAASVLLRCSTPRRNVDHARRCTGVRLRLRSRRRG